MDNVASIFAKLNDAEIRHFFAIFAVENKVKERFPGVSVAIFYLI